MKPIGRRLIIAAFVCAFTWLLPISAEAFDGRAIDRLTGRPIAGATIAIAGLAGTVTTDADGKFTWAPDPPLPFDVLVILPGGGLAKPVRILTRDDNAVLVVSVDPVLAETIVISGSAPSVDAPLATATTLVSSLDIGRRAPANLVQALENVPGVSAVAEGQSAVPAIRGLARGRTLFLLDGSRLFSERRAGPSVTFLAPESLDRIDVVRGPASVAYGSDAFGGVISMLTPQPSLGCAARRATDRHVRRRRPVATRRRRGRDRPRRARRHARRRARPGGRRLLEPGRRRRQFRLAGSAARSSAPASPPVAGGRSGGRATSRQRQRSAAIRFGDPAGHDAVRTIESHLGFIRSRGRAGIGPRQHPRALRQLRAASRSGSPAGAWPPAAHRSRGHRRHRPGDSRGDRGRRSVPRRLSTGVDLVDRHDLHAHDIAHRLQRGRRRRVDHGQRLDRIGTQTRCRRVRAGRCAARVARHRHGGARGSITSAASTTGGFFGDRTVSHSAASGSAAIAARSSMVVADDCGAGLTRIPRSDAVRSLLSRPGRPRLHHRQSGLGTGAEPGNSTPRRRYDADHWRLGASYYHYDISDLIERYQAGPDTFLFRNRGLAEIRGVEVEGRLDAAARIVDRRIGADRPRPRQRRRRGAGRHRAPQSDPAGASADRQERVRVTAHRRDRAR